jgi:hypothetical protein
MEFCFCPQEVYNQGIFQGGISSLAVFSRFYVYLPLLFVKIVFVKNNLNRVVIENKICRKKDLQFFFFCGIIYCWK